jgi:hypothetical protein
LLFSDEVLTAVVLRGIKESENLPLYSVSRQELQQQSAGRPLPFPPATTVKPAGIPAAATSGLGKATPTPQPPPGITMTKVGVAKANIVNVGRAAAATSQPKMAASSSVTITAVGPSPAAAETASGSKRKRNYVPKRAAQVPLVEVGGPKLPKLPRIPKITDKDIRLPSPASLGLPTMPFAPGLLPGKHIGVNFVILLLNLL